MEVSEFGTRQKTAHALAQGMVLPVEQPGQRLAVLPGMAAAPGPRLPHRPDRAAATADVDRGQPQAGLEIGQGASGARRRARWPAARESAKAELGETAPLWSRQILADVPDRPQQAVQPLRRRRGGRVEPGDQDAAQGIAQALLAAERLRDPQQLRGLEVAIGPGHVEHREEGQQPGILEDRVLTRAAVSSRRSEHLLFLRSCGGG